MYLSFNVPEAILLLQFLYDYETNKLSMYLRVHSKLPINAMQKYPTTGMNQF
jgi:hypothetical protein